MLDASVHYVSPTGQYDLAFGGTNLTDDRFITAGSPNYGAGEVGGYYNDPREWYVTLCTCTTRCGRFPIATAA